MDNAQRQSFLDLDRLREQRVFIYLGPLKARIKSLDMRGTRVFMTLEEENGHCHDYDKEIRDIPAFLGRIKFNVLKETTVINIHIPKKRLPDNRLDYDVVTVWRVSNIARYIVFSEGFSSGDFLKKNVRFKFANSPQDKKTAIYLIPTKERHSSYRTTNKKQGKRLGVRCSSISDWLKSDKYTVDIVELNGVIVLKLVEKL